MSATRDITMTQPEIDAFLQRSGHVVVGALDADGWPVGTLAAMSYANGRLALTFADRDSVAVELQRDPHLCCVWDEHVSYFEIQGVIVHGSLADDDTTLDVAKLISFDFGRLR